MARGALFDSLDLRSGRPLRAPTGVGGWRRRRSGRDWRRSRRNRWALVVARRRRGRTLGLALRQLRVLLADTANIRALALRAPEIGLCAEHIASGIFWVFRADFLARRLLLRFFCGATRIVRILRAGVLLGLCRRCRFFAAARIPGILGTEVRVVLLLISRTWRRRVLRRGRSFSDYRRHLLGCGGRLLWYRCRFLRRGRRFTLVGFGFFQLLRCRSFWLCLFRRCLLRRARGPAGVFGCGLGRVARIPLLLPRQLHQTIDARPDAPLDQGALVGADAQICRSGGLQCRACAGCCRACVRRMGERQTKQQCRQYGGWELPQRMRAQLSSVPTPHDAPRPCFSADDEKNRSKGSPFMMWQMLARAPRHRRRSIAQLSDKTAERIQRGRAAKYWISSGQAEPGGLLLRSCQQMFAYGCHRENDYRIDACPLLGGKAHIV